MADQITNETCHTWTHGVGIGNAGKIRVECVAHGVVHDGTREEAKEQQDQHRQEHQQ